jgi:conserved domain protein
MKEYVKPSVAVYLAQHESALLEISAETTNPKEGGDPTGGDKTTPNPFGPSSAKEQWFDEEE